MSSLALSHNFSWSIWNLLSGSRIAVLLMRELIDNKKVVIKIKNFMKLFFIFFLTILYFKLYYTYMIFFF